MVDIDDVYPLEDEYGNKITQRDLTDKVNKKYIKELASTFRDGVPDTPPILVEDGGIYRIKDGNCRIEAMKSLGTKRFPAIIDEEGTEQAIVETVVRTNCKKKYEPIEESRFVQQLALLDADDYVVAKAAGIEPAKVKRIRAGVKIAGDAREDMTLERLIAIEEFADDDEIVDNLINMSDKDWPRYYDRCVNERNDRLEREAIFKALDERGIKHGISGEHPGDYKFLKSVNKAMNVKDLPDDCFVEEGSCWFSVYAPADDAVDPDEEARKAFADAEKIACADDLDHRIKWYERKINSDTEIFDIAFYIHAWLDKFLRGRWPLGEIPKYTMDAATALCAFASDQGNRKNGPYGWDFDWMPYKDEYAETLDTFIECGYDPTEHEVQVLKKCKEANDD